MPRYIKADELKADHFVASTTANTTNYLYVSLSQIENTPTADVRENIHGRWVVDEDGNIECSVCGHHGVGDLYCERCGAIMDENV